MDLSLDFQNTAHVSQTDGTSPVVMQTEQTSDGILDESAESQPLLASLPAQVDFH